MKSHLPRGHYTLTAFFRTLSYLVLCTSLLAPKVSLAVVQAFGGGFHSVVVCTGSGLARITLSPNGDVIDDITTHWTSAHCVLTTEDTDALARRWQHIGYPSTTLIVEPVAVHLAPYAMERWVMLSGRDPPRA